jgi:hypothetical protein
MGPEPVRRRVTAHGFGSVTVSAATSTAAHAAPAVAAGVTAGTATGGPAGRGTRQWYGYAPATVKVRSKVPEPLIPESSPSVKVTECWVPPEFQPQVTLTPVATENVAGVNLKFVITISLSGGGLDEPVESLHPNDNNADTAHSAGISQRVPMVFLRVNAAGIRRRPA